MGKGKKKKANKGKKKDGKKTENDTGLGGTSLPVTPEQMERAISAAANRTEDPLKNWTRLQNEECPICMLPLPLRGSETSYCVTCGKTVCAGCIISAGMVYRRDGGDAKTAKEKATTCPYCRSDMAKDDEQYTLEKEMKRANIGNGEAMFRVGGHYFQGMLRLRQDKAEGLKWFHKAVEAGSRMAAYCLGISYANGDGVEQGIEKALEYFHKSAELGYIHAFSLIGTILMKKGEIEEAMLNYRKAAICGMSDDNLFNALRDGFKCGYITKDEYAYKLRENQAACNEMKSDGRDRIKVWLAQR